MAEIKTSAFQKTPLRHRKGKAHDHILHNITRRCFPQRHGMSCPEADRTLPAWTPLTWQGHAVSRQVRCSSTMGRERHAEVWAISLPSVRGNGAPDTHGTPTLAMARQMMVSGRGGVSILRTVGEVGAQPMKEHRIPRRVSQVSSGWLLGKQGPGSASPVCSPWAMESRMSEGLARCDCQAGRAWERRVCRHQGRGSPGAC